MARVQQAQVSFIPANSGRPVGVRTISIDVGVGAAASTSVCDSGNMGSIPIRPPSSFRDTSIGRRPGSEPGSWRFESSSLNHPAHVGQRLVHRAFNSVIAGSIPRMSTISSHRLVAKDPGLSLRGRRFESGCEYHRTHFPVVHFPVVQW